MTTNTVFKIVYWSAVLIEMGIRAPLRKRWKSTAKTESRLSTTERLILGLLFVGDLVFPLIYTFTGWISFADYHLPPWMGWMGVAIMAFALFIFIRAHADLKANWSPTLEIFESHTLVTNGIYRVIRHPMYASQWLFCIAQLLLLQNWLAGPLNLIIFIPFYYLRVRAEEQMMIDRFGEQYRSYRQKTGAVIPRM